MGVGDLSFLTVIDRIVERDEYLRLLFRGHEAEGEGGEEVGKFLSKHLNIVYMKMYNKYENICTPLYIHVYIQLYKCTISKRNSNFERNR